MRKVLIAVAALLFFATPATSQQILARHQAEQEAAMVREAPRSEQTEQPSLFPTTEQVKEDVRNNEDRLAQDQGQIGSKDWWYIVAAVAIGVIIAAVVLD
ncbi:MAG TPA: hypothetical protein VFS20_05505 [Longimicrobium sp.]|nr:hypothetical protein [Longimicrobium sp.]